MELLGRAASEGVQVEWVTGVRQLVARYPSKSTALRALPPPFRPRLVALALVLRIVQHGVLPPNVAAANVLGRANDPSAVSLAWCWDCVRAVCGRRGEQSGLLIAVAEWCLAGDEVDAADVETLLCQVREMETCILYLSFMNFPFVVNAAKVTLSLSLSLSLSHTHTHAHKPSLPLSLSLLCAVLHYIVITSVP